MNKLIQQFNVKGDLWSFTYPFYLKNFQYGSAKKNEIHIGSNKNNSREWYSEIKDNSQQLTNVDLVKLKEIKTKQALLSIWILSNNLNTIKPEYIEIADFIVVKYTSKEIIDLGKINFHHIPIGIPLVLSNSIFGSKRNIQENNLIALFDELLLLINSWRHIGVKDVFLEIGIDFSESQNNLNLISLLKKLSILKYLTIPIVVRISNLDSFSYKVGFEILVESIFDLGCILIRAENSDKIAQLVSLRKKRFSLENGK